MASVTGSGSGTEPGNEAGGNGAGTVARARAVDRTGAADEPRTADVASGDRAGTVQRVISVIEDRRPKVAIVGDFLLDGWWVGHSERIAREAPAPVVDLERRSYAPGGAANTAVNLAALGAQVQAVGVVGADESGEILRELLAEAGVDVRYLRAEPGFHTTTKVRVSVDDQLLLRLDETEESRVSPEARDRCIGDLASAAQGADAQLICDYGGSLLDDRVVEAIAEGARPPIRIVDAHDPVRWRRVAPDAVTPNAQETERVLGLALGHGERRVPQAAHHGAALRERTGAHAVVVTLDRTGTVTLRANHPPHQTRATPAPERHASGAGDVFVAALTTATACGILLEDAADFAQAAADVAVQTPGTCVCRLEDLRRSAASTEDDRGAATDLASRLDEHRRRGERIVFTNGCFDVLHRGHTSYLRQAKQLGDVLVVALNSDASVSRLKGPERPINDVADRAGVVAALACVDYVTVFEEDTPVELIRELRPDIYAKGGDYTPEMLPETPVVQHSGGEVVILDYVPDHSTTEIIGRIRAPRPEDAFPDSSLTESGVHRG